MIYRWMCECGKTNVMHTVDISLGSLTRLAISLHTLVDLCDNPSIIDICKEEDWAEGIMGQCSFLLKKIDVV
jgi:hypothetical protein